MLVDSVRKRFEKQIAIAKLLGSVYDCWGINFARRKCCIVDDLESESLTEK